MIDNEKVRRYRLTQTQSMPNLKELDGKTLIPRDMLEHEYQDPDGEFHKVLAVDFGPDGMYRTEVSAFIEKFRNYWDVFGADDEKPAIIIMTSKSKRGNPYVNFDIAI